jgi:hypothetical protein
MNSLTTVFVGKCGKLHSRRRHYEYSWSFCNAKLPIPCNLGEKLNTEEINLCFYNIYLIGTHYSTICYHFLMSLKKSRKFDILNIGILAPTIV